MPEPEPLIFLRRDARDRSQGSRSWKICHTGYQVWAALLACQGMERRLPPDNYPPFYQVSFRPQAVIPSSACPIRSSTDCIEVRVVCIRVAIRAPFEQNEMLRGCRILRLIDGPA